MMNKQVRLYCIKLNLVRTKEEKSLGKIRNDLNQEKYNFKKSISKLIKKKLKTENWNEECSKLFKKVIGKNNRYKKIEEDLKQIKEDIRNLYTANKDINRRVWSENIKTKDVIAIGDNNLVRTLELDLGTFTDKIITVKVGDMDDSIVQKVIKDGLNIMTKYGQEPVHYKFFTAGAGQTRTKKFMMIKNDENLNEVMLSLMCGLTIEDINKNGGMNISKFMAYLSLNNSGSKVWEGFDIDKCIVVGDFETMVSATVDYIDRNDKVKDKPIIYITKKGKEITRKKTKVEWNIEKNKTMDVPVPHFDGLGLVLNKKYKKNIQIRCPWIKGLLTYFNVVGYCKKNGYSLKVKDIYGKEYDIVEDDIQVIFTKSQFKLWEFYKDWNDYKTKFKENNCTVNICMEDNNKKSDYKDMNINYQMLQQLVNMEDKHIKVLTSDFKKLITKVHTDRNSQLEFLGATKENNNRSYFQEALRLYPEMLTSSYCRKKISDTITSEKKKACSGKIKIKDSKRVFILSDPTAFCDWLFGGIEKPTGYLQNNEVYCNLYENETELDVLRSPSLSFEHCIRNNIRATEGKYDWYETNGLYTSTHDVISKILAFDVDGDEALVLSTNWIIKLAKDMIKKYDIKPIYFEMGKAPAIAINNENIAKSLLFVYHKSNIGKVSNKLTNLWNSENPMEKYPLMQKLCAYNNDVIDSAKTLDIPKIPKDVRDVLRKEKYPYFFQYAKNKKELECKPISNSTMDKICKDIESIGDTKFDYRKGFGTFRVKTLLNNQDNIEVNKDVIAKYLELEEITLNNINEYAREFENKDEEDMKKTNFKEMFYTEARMKFLDYCKSIGINYTDCVDMMIKYTYKVNDLKMAFMWNVFGAVIINNLNKNIKKSLDDDYLMCVECGKRVKREANNQIRCTACKKKQSHKAKGDSEKVSKMA